MDSFGKMTADRYIYIYICIISVDMTISVDIKEGLTFSNRTLAILRQMML